MSLFVPGAAVSAAGVDLRIRSIDGNVAELETDCGSFFGFRHVNSLTVCAPPVLEAAIGVVAQSDAVGSGERASKANLDLNDKLVKRGLTVSWHGYRGPVQRVRTGRCLVHFPIGRGPSARVETKWLPCASVQVVAA